MRGLALVLLLTWILPPAARAAECVTSEYDGARFSWCRIDLEREQLRLWLTAPDGQPYGTFARIDQQLQPEGAQVGVAMNAGMFHPDRSPVGLFIEDGAQSAPIVTRAGPGNFGMLPNGVFCIGKDRAAVVESRAFAADPPPCLYATQSGPLLLKGGRLHPKFLKESKSRHIRNGVGVSQDGREVVLAISDEPVNFHHFARFFRDVAGTPDALYFDGEVSRLYAPELDRWDGGLPLGPIIGTVVPGG